MSLDKHNREIKGASYDPDTDSLKAIRDAVVETQAGHHREKIYPYDTVGGLVTCGNEVWGATIVTVPIDAITDDYGWDTGTVVPYAVVGFSLIGVSAPAVQCTLQHFRVVKTSVQVLDVDSGLGETPADRIYVPLTGGFLVDDWVWVVDDDTGAGEISQIDAIVTDDYLDMDGDLAALYSVVQNAKVYLVRRVTDNGEYRCLWTDFSISTAKDLVFHPIHAHRQMEAGDGMIARGRSVETGAPTVRVTVVYDDS